MRHSFRLKAIVRSANESAISDALAKWITKGSVRKAGSEFIIDAEMEGTSAKEVNRTLLSALRKIEKKTTLRAEWTSDNTTDRFFDYVLKKTSQGPPA
jgi:hypothetical protein